MHPERDFIPRKRPGNFVAGMLVPAMPSIVIKRVLLGCLLSALLFGIVAISETASSSGTLGINLFGNGSFETPRADGALPEGWSLAYGSQVEPPPVAYPDVSQPEWAGDPGPRTGDRYLQFIVDPSAESRTELVRDDLVPVKSDTDYRLQMAYRFQEVDETAENIHLSRLWFGVRHYYDANPGGEPDPQLFEPQIDYVDSLCCGSLAPAEKTQWTLVEENIRFESAGYDVDGVLRQVAWIQVYLLTNDWFRGTLAVDDVSLVELASAVIEPPASSLAFDFVPRVCDAASENAGLELRRQRRRREPFPRHVASADGVREGEPREPPGPGVRVGLFEVERAAMRPVEPEPHAGFDGPLCDPLDRLLFEAEAPSRRGP